MEGYLLVAESMAGTNQRRISGNQRSVLFAKMGFLQFRANLETSMIYRPKRFRCRGQVKLYMMRARPNMQKARPKVGSVDPNKLLSYYWHSRQISTRLHSSLRQMRLIILCGIFENESASSQSEVRATSEGPILESSHSSLALGGESVFVIPGNKSSTSRFLSRRRPPVS